METTPLGIVIDTIQMHPRKASFPMLVTPLGMTILFNREQPKNTRSPNVVTFLGIRIFSSEAQPSKEPDLSEVIFSDNVIFPTLAKTSLESAPTGTFLFVVSLLSLLQAVKEIPTNRTKAINSPFSNLLLFFSAFFSSFSITSLNNFVFFF